MDRHWYTVKAKPRQDTQATKSLTHLGIEVFAPRICSRPRTVRAAPRFDPLFPGYFFTRLDIKSGEWVATRSAPGVAYYLGSADAPTSIPDALIDVIRARVGENVKCGWEPPFRQGDAVMIERGAFMGVDAIFDQALSGQGRVRVLLQLVGRLAPLDLDVQHIRRRWGNSPRKVRATA